MKFYLLFAVFLFSGAVLNTATVAAAKPLSQQLSLPPLSDKAKLQLPIIDTDKASQSAKVAKQTDPKNIGVRPLQIATASSIGQSVKQIGQWQNVKDKSVWRLHLSANSALHLNLGFKKMHLPASATLFILDAKSGEIYQQYSAADNKFHGELWTPIIASNELIVEINLSTSDVQQLELELLQAGQGIKVINPGVYNNKSGSCNIDVICPQGNNWRDEIRAVARYTISDSSGTYLCTGTLINNTRGDLAPLFLTAAHCNVSDTTTTSMVFYWNYETSVCAGIEDGALDQNQNGASLVSRFEGLSANSDFALVRLDTMPDASFNVHYAGWDNRDQIYTGVRAIHHPSGDEKRISIDNDALTITNYSTDATNANGHFLRIGAWDEGTTEGGSSGSGLWNLNHHLVGTLSGGGASCDALLEPDWYGRLASHWSGNNFSSNQLAPHLDPVNSASATLDGIDSCAAPTVSFISSNNTPAINEQINLTSTVIGGAGGYSYEWDFDNDGTVDSNNANPVHTYNGAANNIITLVVRDSAQCPAIASKVLLVADSSEAFLADGALPAGFAKSATSTGSWVVDDSRASEGIFSLKSQVVNEDKDSGIEISGTYEAGNISFDHRVSSEATFDFFKFFIDGVEQLSLSGELGWQSACFPVTAADHTFRWQFVKDGGLSEGEDAAWIDNLLITDATGNCAPLKVSSIADQTDSEGDSVNLNVSANFSDPDDDNLSYSLENAPASLNIDANSGVITGTLTAADAAASPYSVEVKVSDGAVEIASAFNWTVNAAAPPPPPPTTPPTTPSSGGGGGSTGFILLMLLLVARQFRVKL